MDCKAKTTIRSGTFMMHSKLPIDIWYQCMFLMASTAKPISASEMQQRLGWKRYEPIWYMMQKIRLAMGTENAKIKLKETVEFDDGFFTAHKREKDPDQHLFNSARCGKGVMKRRQRRARMKVRFECRQALDRRFGGAPVGSEVHGRPVELRPLRGHCVCGFLSGGDERVAGDEGSVTLAPQ